MFPRRLLFKEKTDILASVNKHKIYNVLFFLITIANSISPFMH